MPKPETHDIRIRVTDEQHTELQEAARKAGLTLSAWMRSLALDAARKKERR